MIGLRGGEAAASGAVIAAASALGLLATGLPRAAPGSVGGATYAVLSSHARTTGLMVTSLRTGGPEARAGLRVGDVIETVNGRHRATRTLLRAEEARSGATLLRVRRGGDVMTLRLLGNPREGARDEDPAGRGR